MQSLNFLIANCFGVRYNRLALLNRPPKTVAATRARMVMMDLIAIAGLVIEAAFESELEYEIQLLIKSKIFGSFYTHDFLSNSLESPEIFFFEGDLMAAQIRSQHKRRYSKYYILFVKNN